MKAPCPGCKASLDVNELSGYSHAKQITGKYCPQCGHPLDEATANSEGINYGGSTDAVRAARVKGAAEFEAACAEPVTSSTSKAKTDTK